MSCLRLSCVMDVVFGTDRCLDRLLKPLLILSQICFKSFSLVLSSSGCNVPFFKFQYKLDDTLCSISLSWRGISLVRFYQPWFQNEAVVLWRHCAWLLATWMYAVQKNAMFPGATIIAFLYLCCHNAASVSSLAKISAMFAHRRHNLAFRPLKNSLCFSNSSATLSSSSLLMMASSMLR